MAHHFTAIVRAEDEWYVASCPEVGTVSQGKTFDEAVENLKEATELFLEESDDLDLPTSRPTAITHFETAI
jgi:predicted RNase H-like HicB family nuclease